MEWTSSIVAGGIAGVVSLASIKNIIIIIIFLIVLFYGWQWYKEYKKKCRRQAIEEQCQSTEQTETIFVSIASYRDPECCKTLLNLFEQAYCPFRIYVGVCQQNDVGDEDVLAGYKRLVEETNADDFSSQIRIWKIPASEAKGPMLARSLIETNLYRNEKYYFITDSHMLFTPHWDKKILDEWHMCKKMSQKPILTCYPADFKPHHRIFSPPNFGFEVGSFLRFKKFNEKTNLIEIEGPAFQRKPSTPVLGLFWAGCFSFGLATMIQEVPFDPFCPYAFFGEEISMSMRLWTSGYDFYHPTTTYVYHMWDRNGRPTFWQQFSDKRNPIHVKRMEQEIESLKRLAALFQPIIQIYHQPSNSNVSNPNPYVPQFPYGLGTVRSLSDYENWIGIKSSTKQILSLTGIMGMPENASAPDILCRFGTWSQFNQIKTTLIKETTSQL